MSRRRLRRPTTPAGWGGAVALGIAGVLLAVNLALVATHLVAWGLSDETRELGLDHVPRARWVTEEVWRGRDPGPLGYVSLATRDVDVVVDMRAEALDEPLDEVVEELGMRLVRIPIRDGQTPTAEQVARFLDVVSSTDGTVYFHCGAGVGRTGAMAAAYRAAVQTEVSNLRLVWQNFQIGPPSIEQIWYAATVDAGEVPSQPPTWVSAVSRVFDGPRRLAHVVLGDE